MKGLKRLELGNGKEYDNFLELLIAQFEYKSELTEGEVVTIESGNCKICLEKFEAIERDYLKASLVTPCGEVYALGTYELWHDLTSELNIFIYGYNCAVNAVTLALMGCA